MEKNVIFFKNIKFYNYSFRQILNKIKFGGYLVAPAASSLSKISSNSQYYNALKNSTVAIFDSGFFCILLFIHVSPYFSNHIEPLLSIGKNILIAAHGNSLRAILIRVGLYKPEEISTIELPTGKPLCLDYIKGKIINNYYLE